MSLPHHTRTQVWRAEMASWRIPVRTLIGAVIFFTTVASAVTVILEASPTNIVP